jgi:CHAD domain-containing protein
MTDLLPPDGMNLARVGQALASHLEITERGSGEVDRTFYDTFDGLLHERALVCSYETGQLSLVDLDNGQVVAASRMVPPTGPLLARDLVAGGLRDALLPIIDLRALLPLVHIRARVAALSVLDGAQKTVVRVTLEEPAVVASGSRRRTLRRRVRLTPVRGYEDELDTVIRALELELGFRPADQTLVDEAVRATGTNPGGVSAKIDVPLEPAQRADEAASAVLKRLLVVIEANIEGTIADLDSEFLHDFRVAVRRTRSVQRELKGVFPPPDLTYFRAEFRWLQQITGDSRDLDVYVLEFDEYRAMVPPAMHADLDPLLEVLGARRRRARAEMAEALRCDRATATLAGWSSLLDRLPIISQRDRPDAGRPIAALAAERIVKVYRRMVKMGRAIDDSSPPSDYHELRKKGKELRYLLELFGAPLYPADVVKPMIRTLKALQDVLGRHQDREVQVAMLLALRDDVAALPGGAAALMATGVLVTRLGEDARAARAEFAGTFKEFAGKQQRHLVQETFG